MQFNGNYSNYGNNGNNGNFVRIKERYELKNDAKIQLTGNWGSGALIIFIMSVIAGAIISVGMTLTIVFSPDGVINLVPAIIGYIATYFVIAGMSAGMISGYLQLTENKNLSVEILFSKFNLALKVLGLMLLMVLTCWLASILFVIPGIILGLAYSMSIYIMVDNPEISIIDAMKLSRNMMRGHKWRYFVFQLSFIGWSMLVPITCYIGMFFLVPYMQASLANFYVNLKEFYKMTGNNIYQPNQYGQQFNPQQNGYGQSNGQQYNQQQNGYGQSNAQQYNQQQNGYEQAKNVNIYNQQQNRYGQTNSQQYNQQQNGYSQSNGQQYNQQQNGYSQSNGQQYNQQQNGYSQSNGQQYNQQQNGYGQSNGQQYNQQQNGYGQPNSQQYNQPKNEYGQSNNDQYSQQQNGYQQISKEEHNEENNDKK